MKAKRLVLLAALGGLVVLASGCEWMRWLRLLSLKKQLAEVERYVRIDDQEGLRLRLLKPVVYPDDISLLVAGETARTTNRNQITWQWIYEKQRAGTNAETGDFELAFAMLFENLKLSEVRFSERFLGLMPKPLILGLLRSVGQAELDVKRGTVKAKWVGPGPNQRVELPTRSRIVALLGAPFLVTESNRTQTMLYKYYQRAPASATPAERLAWATFVVADDGEQVLSSEGVIGDVGWSMRRTLEDPEPRITFSLVSLSVEPVALKLPPAIADEFVGRYQEPGGATLDIGRDGEVFVASWKEGWCTALPELTNVLFALPSGYPRYSFLRDPARGGAVTGLVAQAQNSERHLAKRAERLAPGPAVARVEPEVYQAYAGRYKPAWGGTVILRPEGERLFWQNQGIRAQVPLYPASATNFFFRAVDSPLTFVRDERGAVTKFILHYHGRTAEAVKAK